MRDSLKLAATWVAFYISWFTAVIGAKNDSNLPALFATLAMVALQFIFYRKAWKQEVKLALFVILIGSMIDTFYLNLGVIQYQALGPITWFCPPWVACLYLQFACTITALSSRFKRYPILLSLLSGIGGWASYRAAIVVGAAKWGYFYSGIIIAVVWAVMVPLFCAFSNRMYKVDVNENR